MDQIFFYIKFSKLFILFIKLFINFKYVTICALSITNVNFVIVVNAFRVNNEFN